MESTDVVVISEVAAESLPECAVQASLGLITERQQLSCV